MASSPSAVHRRLKRKRTDDDYAHESHERESVLLKRKCSTNRAMNSSRLLACPILKHDPTRFRSQRSCSSGWPSISRLKEHLFRNHEPKPTCPRCQSMFRTRDDVDVHLQLPYPCPIIRTRREDETQLTEYAKRTLSKRTRKGDDPAHAWVQIYKTCFPSVRDEDVPSPYVETAEDESRRLRHDASRELFDYIHARVPAMLQRVIQKHGVSRRHSTDLATSLLSQLTSMIEAFIDPPDECAPAEISPEPSSSLSSNNANTMPFVFIAREPQRSRYSEEPEPTYYKEPELTYFKEPGTTYSSDNESILSASASYSRASSPISSSDYIFLPPKKHDPPQECAAASFVPNQGYSPTYIFNESSTNENQNLDNQFRFPLQPDSSSYEAAIYVPSSWGI
ncbi:hypothetical protein EJ04DRAFT_551441 [Polyplosphaeria fusca]|uniref:C2H2-type domain-containing protein n=1 Tax=Polyplosphaeria fusca TaxID=682080 RepID=A0A9P4R156_9PLEO|nr:hypothetical protein EJ04DRAFT_551441 [Polyplosphaeria fusca]